MLLSLVQYMLSINDVIRYASSPSKEGIEV